MPIFSSVKATFLSQPNSSLPTTRPHTQRIGVLARRQTEARILAPVIAALADAFSRNAVVEIVRKTIIKIAREQGAELAELTGGCAAAYDFRLRFPPESGAV